MMKSTFLANTLKSSVLRTGLRSGSVRHFHMTFSALQRGAEDEPAPDTVESMKIDTKKSVMISNIYQLNEVEGQVPQEPKSIKDVRPGQIAVSEPMLIKKKPTSNGVRHAVLLSKKHMAKKPFGPLVQGRVKVHAGRNHQGKITVRHKEGGHKKRYRLVDFKRESNHNVPAVVQSIEYDPMKRVNLALVYYKNGVFSYIPATAGMKVGDIVYNAYHPDTDASKLIPGDRTLIKYLPSNTQINNIEYTPGRGAQMCRSGGTFATVMYRVPHFNVVAVKMPTGRIMEICGDCKVTIGRNSGSGHNQQNLGKAGRSRWLGVRPHVRGVAMNPVDHPHGGGEGKKSKPSTPLNWKGRPQSTSARHNKYSSLTDNYQRMIRSFISGSSKQLSEEMRDVLEEVDNKTRSKKSRKGKKKKKA